MENINLAFHSLLRWKMIANSHYFMCLVNFGVKGLNMWCVPCKDMTKGPEQSIYKCEMDNIV